jgi:hypothetical protein
MADLIAMQDNFSGGADQLVVRHLIGENRFFEAENAEVREGECRTRRGSFRLLEEFADSDFRGAGAFININNTSIPYEQFILALDIGLFRIVLPDEIVELTMPDTEDADNFLFVQAIESLYIFRGAGYDVVKWTGDTADALVDVGGNMPPSDRVLYEYNRFWIVTDLDTLNPSDALSENFNINASFKINQGKDGERVVALHPFPDNHLIAFKEKSIALIGNASGISTITTAQNITLQFVDNQYGLVGRDAVVSVGKDVWFLSRKGVMSVVLNEQQKAQLISVPISAQIERTFERINFAQAEKATAALVKNYVLFAVPLDDNETNSHLLVYDLINRCWVDNWTNHNARKFIASREPFTDALYYFNDTGSLIELYTGLYEDFVCSKVRKLIFADAADQLEVSSVLTGTGAIGGLASGAISLRIRIDDLTSDGNIVDIRNAGATDRLRIYIEGSLLKAELLLGGIAQWRFSTPDIPTGRFVFLNLLQDGITASFYISGFPTVETYSVSLDLTRWLDDLAETVALIGSTTSAKFTLDQIIFSGPTGFDDIKAVFALDEGSGTTVTDGKNGKTGTITGADWNAPCPDPEPIPFLLRTRNYDFGRPFNPKSLSVGELAIFHRDPQLTLDISGEGPFIRKNAFTDRQYSFLPYFIHGRPDWNPSNINNDHDAPYRENYAPLFIGPGGVEFPGSGEIPDGLTLEQEQEHVEHLHEILCDTAFSLEIRNSRGTVSIKNIMLTANSRAYGVKRSMALQT